MRFRRLVLVAVAYLAGAVVLDLLVRALVPVLVLPPDLTTTVARVMIALGFLVTLAAAWSYEGTGGSGGGGRRAGG